MLLEIAAVTVIIAALHAASGLLFPITVAFFLAVLSYPVMRWLNRRMPLGVALPLTFAAIVSAVACFLLLTVHLGRELQKDQPTYLMGLDSWIKSTAAYLESHGLEGATLTVAEFNFGSLIDLASKQEVFPRLRPPLHPRLLRPHPRLRRTPSTQERIIGARTSVRSAPPALPFFSASSLTPPP